MQSKCFIVIIIRILFLSQQDLFQHAQGKQSSQATCLLPIFVIITTNFNNNCPNLCQQLLKVTAKITRHFVNITMFEAVELPGSVAHLDSSLSNVDAYHLPLNNGHGHYYCNIILQRHKNLRHGFLGQGRWPLFVVYQLLGLGQDNIHYPSAKKFVSWFFRWETVVLNKFYPNFMIFGQTIFFPQQLLLLVFMTL